MSWTFESDRPIYTQLLDKIKLMIITEAYPPGSRLPSVRELASEAAVNPNTMQKALAELEKSGLIYSQRTTGRYVTQDEALIIHLKEDMASRYILEFFMQMKKLGITSGEAQKLVEKSIKEREL